MNRISAVANAVDYEIKRQINCIETKEKIIQETRGWSEEKAITISQRTKEESNDYRYFPEPDIPPLIIENKWIEEIKNKIPTLPEKRKTKYLNDYGLSPYDANLLANEINFSDFFEKTVLKLPEIYKNNETIKYVANLMNGEFNRLLNIDTSKNISEIKFRAEDLVDLVVSYKENKINNKILKTVFEEMWVTGNLPNEIISKKNLAIISNSEELEKKINNIIENNPKAVEDFKAGREQSKKFLLGQVMRETKGQADPVTSEEIITILLEQKK